MKAASILRRFFLGKIVQYYKGRKQNKYVGGTLENDYFYSLNHQQRRKPANQIIYEETYCIIRNPDHLIFV